MGVGVPIPLLLFIWDIPPSIVSMDRLRCIVSIHEERSELVQELHSDDEERTHARMAEYNGGNTPIPTPPEGVFIHIF
jgi:hypothetical protein